MRSEWLDRQIYERMAAMMHEESLLKVGGGEGGCPVSGKGINAERGCR